MRQLKITQTKHNNSDILNKYYFDINQLPNITLDQELELGNRIKNGDQKAVDILVQSNLKFVISVAKQFTNMGLDIEDLISVGNIALIKAAQKFNADLGFKFISFAVWQIRADIMQELNRNKSTVKLPSNQIVRFNRLKSEITNIEQTNGYAITYNDIDNLCNNSHETLAYFNMYCKKEISLDVPVTDDGFTLSQTLVSSDQNIEYNLDTKQKIDIINDKLSNMISYKREIIQDYFGFNNNIAMSISALSDKYQLTEFKIIKIIDSVLKDLRVPFKKEIGKVARFRK